MENQDNISITHIFDMLQEVSTYELCGYEAGLYEVKNENGILFEMISLYEPNLWIPSRERLQTVQIKSNNIVMMSSVFDIETTIVSGLKRTILNSSDNEIAFIRVRDNYDEVVIKETIKLKVKTRNHQKTIFVNEQNKVVAFIEFDALSGFYGKIKISKKFIEECNPMKEIAECIIAAYPLLKFSI